MTDTPLDLDAILAAHASASPYGRTEVAGRFHASYYADDADVALVFASVPALVAALRKAEAQVADVLALHTPTRVWLRSTPEPTMACGICQDPWPCITAAAVDAPADVPMSPNTGHDLRERIAQRIDQAWAEANDQRPRSEYRDGYLDGLEHAEAAARSTPLTMGGAS